MCDRTCTFKGHAEAARGKTGGGEAGRPVRGPLQVPRLRGGTAWTGVAGSARPSGSTHLLSPEVPGSVETTRAHRAGHRGSARLTCRVAARGRVFLRPLQGPCSQLSTGHQLSTCHLPHKAGPGSRRWELKSLGPALQTTPGCRYCQQHSFRSKSKLEAFESLSHFVTHQHKATPPEASSANQEL